ncbi:ferredoxin [Rhodococcus sp. IEGM 1305]|uniref:ferredoxin n=1 Tax=Rhodococcus sp. IEGM 1305 TaxID=3047092 RepID=UPI0012172CBE|nr:ferredoxin [Rhodococcus sp. IEGM 1305]MDT2006463.1 ferredoxin [Rhodococcus opacus]NDV06068.1 ferredoxin [Rhodococcus sp. IEGM 248]RZI53467.1 MAG: ferredoxin [Pseudonocardia sp.]MDI9951371.1 ferredoxin [Rhodococcus sp. IEGM 1305]MDT2009750.1 ferredoxin [Rhodococcus opacus]
MDVRVDYGMCQDHGQCAIAAPKVFQMDDDGKLVYDKHPDDSQRDEVEEAADVCPVQAIFLDES